MCSYMLSLEMIRDESSVGISSVSGFASCVVLPLDIEPVRFGKGVEFLGAKRVRLRFVGFGASECLLGLSVALHLRIQSLHLIVPSAER